MRKRNRYYPVRCRGAIAVANLRQRFWWIDTRRHTATVLDQVTEPSLKYSAAEGSATRLPDGHWVVSWGATRLVSERTSSNRPVWRLALFGAQNFHVQPIFARQLPAPVLRRAMDALTARQLRRQRASRG